MRRAAAVLRVVIAAGDNELSAQRLSEFAIADGRARWRKNPEIFMRLA
jgi:hypothetical protein